MSKSRDIADSAATINYIDGLTSDAQGQLDDKATLDGSPTFTGTVTATAFSGDGSGLTGVDSLPSQTGNNGLFLTTDGSTASWAAAGGGAWEIVQTYTPSAASTVDIEAMTSDYDEYMIIIHNINANSDGDLRVYLKVDGSYKTSNYQFYRDRFYGSGSYQNTINASYSRIDVGNSQYLAGRLYINNRNNSSNYYPNLHWDTLSIYGSSTPQWSWGRAIYNGSATSKVTQGVRIEIAGQTMSGTITLYGAKKS